MDRFTKCYEFIKKAEGGFNCLPSDTGGMTIFGIARKFNPDCAFWAKVDSLLDKGDLDAPVGGNSIVSKRITHLIVQDKEAMDEIRKVYYNRYWVASHAYQLPAPLDMIQMDAYFNMGITANKILQNWCGAEQDGIIGKNTLKAIRDCKNPIPELFSLRWDYYCTRPNFNKFGNGWKNRIKTLALACGFDIKL